MQCQSRDRRKIGGGEIVIDPQRLEGGNRGVRIKPRGKVGEGAAMGADIDHRGHIAQRHAVQGIILEAEDRLDIRLRVVVEDKGGHIGIGFRRKRAAISAACSVWTGSARRIRGNRQVAAGWSRWRSRAVASARRRMPLARPGAFAVRRQAAGRQGP